MDKRVGLLIWTLLLAPAPTTTFAQSENQSEIYIHAGTVLELPGQSPREAVTLIVRGSQIAAVLEGYVSPPNSASLIDLRDKFVLPGLIDMHVHIFSDDDRLQARLEQTNRDIEDNVLIGVVNARRNLEAGFTTIRDLGSDIRSVTALRDAINNGNIAGPTIVPAGRMLSVTAGHGDPTNNRNREATSAARMLSENVCDGPEDCRRAVRSQVSQGAEVIKFAATGGVNSNIGAGLEQQLLPDEMRAIVETAHLLGLKVAAHAHGRNGIAAALEAGVDSIEHGTYTDAATNSLFKQYNAWLVPTIVAGAASLEMARQGATSEASLLKAEQAVAVQRENIAAAIEDGVPIAFGTDTGVADHGYNAREFRLLVELGMTPMDAIHAATVSAAELLGRSEQLGTLEAGKQADIVAVDENPLENVSSLETMSFVMKSGQLIILDGERQAFPAAGYR